MAGPATAISPLEARESMTREELARGRVEERAPFTPGLPNLTGRRIGAALDSEEELEGELRRDGTAGRRWGSLEGRRADRASAGAAAAVAGARELARGLARVCARERVLRAR
ncbi:MAG TPA: hypothetical protein VFB42_04685 [Gaiellaceae bacterium]|nr:hypothetical protein [Gaiellaceae bacterium]